MNSEEKYDAFVKEMHEKYPKMFSQPYGGFAVGEGWWPILRSLCSNIQGHINHVNDYMKHNREKFKYAEMYQPVEQVVVEQIKEKFGGLRFYYTGGDSYIDGLVDMAESWASHTCEECGAPGKSRSGGWIRTLCDVHEAERQNKMKG